MPLPVIGDTWINKISGVEGIVARVTQNVNTIVTFVSLIGNRVSVVYNDSFEQLWERKNFIPSHTLKCS